MILGNRRLRLLYSAMAGMDMAVLLPWLTVLSIFWARNGDPGAMHLAALLTQSPLLLFILFWSVTQFYMLVADWLNRAKLADAARAALILVLLAFTSLIAIRVLLYPKSALNDFIWLRESTMAVVNLVAGVRGEILLIVTNYFLWWRVARYSDRDLTFFSVGLSFRLGMLLSIVGCTFLSYWRGYNEAAILYMILFFAFGLAAVALARIDQKAIGAADRSGSLLPWDRFAQLWIVIITLLSAAIAASTFYTPPLLRTVLGWFSPLGWLLQWLLAQIAYILFLVLTPMLEWLASRIQEIIAESPPQAIPEEIATPQPLTLTEAVQQVVWLRYCIGAAIVFGAIVLLLVFFGRPSQRARSEESEDTDIEGALRPGGIRLGLDRLKDWFALLARYGVGRQLLDAISVENIYANLTRLARRKGFPRHPAQGPDSYLPNLQQAFPGHEAGLSAITAAYLRVRYGERPISAQELEALRAAYIVITTPSEKDAPQAATP